ncbi:MAG: hypothetical protein Q4C16_03410 [Eubacteriales bacterium]|nr:hypothetical protein [Eubacteriales bacterium]
MKERLIEALYSLPGHLAAAAAAVLLCIILPGYFFTDLPARLAGNADAVSSASMEIPDQPSGSFLVLIKSDLHEDTLGEWTDFFTEQPVGVIMEDLHCFVDQADVSGQEAADRYRLRLAENQMTVTKENGTLLVSKAENGLFDVIVLSKEMADLQDYEKAMSREDVTAVMVESAAKSTAESAAEGPAESTAGSAREGPAEYSAESADESTSVSTPEVKGIAR